MKARIRQTVWGNWYGYRGTRKVISFENTATQSQEQAARVWLACSKPFNSMKPPTTKPAKKSAVKKPKPGRVDTGRHVQPPRYSQASRDKLDSIATARSVSMAEALEQVIDGAHLNNAALLRKK